MMTKQNKVSFRVFSTDVNTRVKVGRVDESRLMLTGDGVVSCFCWDGING